MQQQIMELFRVDVAVGIFVVLAKLAVAASASPTQICLNTFTCSGQEQLCLLWVGGGVVMLEHLHPQLVGEVMTKPFSSEDTLTCRLNHLLGLQTKPFSSTDLGLTSTIKATGPHDQIDAQGKDSQTDQVDTQASPPKPSNLHSPQKPSNLLPTTRKIATVLRQGRKQREKGKEGEITTSSTLKKPFAAFVSLQGYFLIYTCARVSSALTHQPSLSKCPQLGVPDVVYW